MIVRYYQTSLRKRSTTKGFAQTAAVQVFAQMWGCAGRTRTQSKASASIRKSFKIPVRRPSGRHPRVALEGLSRSVRRLVARRRVRGLSKAPLRMLWARAGSFRAASGTKRCAQGSADAARERHRRGKRKAKNAPGRTKRWLKGTSRRYLQHGCHKRRKKSEEGDARNTNFMQSDFVFSMFSEAAFLTMFQRFGRPNASPGGSQNTCLASGVVRRPFREALRRNFAP